jgi:hypothetical protein
VSPLIESLLKVQATDHRKIQEEIRRNLEELGYDVELEKKIWAGRKGKIDVFAQKGNFSVGIEVDHFQLRKKSIEKLNELKPSLAIFLLKARNINRKATYLRAKLIRVNSLLVHLPAKRVEKIGPRFLESEDEFQNFATKSFIETLSEARKYRLSLILAHQNLSQLPKELQGFGSLKLRNSGLF